MSSKFKQDNLVEFINHLLTFNKQMDLYQQKFPNDNNNLQDLFNKVNLPFRFNISAKVIIKLSELARELFAGESNVIKIKAPLNMFGDIHGQYSDMIRFLEMTGLPPDQKFLFLGDYVDRGNNSIEVVALLFALKIIYPNHVYVLRGNHECPNVNSMYGLLTECEERFGKDSKLVFDKINDALISLPLCAIVNNKIFCVHGGLSPSLVTLDNINEINRFMPIPDSGLLCDLLWSDPSLNIDSLWGTNSRGVSCTFSSNSVHSFLHTNNLQLVCRAHQLVPNGYKFFADSKLITIFSAPNYCGNCGNDGVVMKVTPQLECSFLIIKPTSQTNFRNIDNIS